MNPPPTLAQIVETLVAGSEEAVDSPRLVEIIRQAVEQRRSESDEEETALPPEWEALLAVDEEAVDLAVATINARLEAGGHALAIVRRPRGWKLMTRPEFADFLTVLFPERRSQRLSGPALETLSIIAYRQPVTKAEIESVRGVSVDGMIQKLLDLELVRIGGRAELPGRPLLYVTTEKFLEHFNLLSTEDLPNIQELARVRLPSAEEVHRETGTTAAPPPSEEPTAPPAEDPETATGSPAGDAEPEPGAKPPAAAAPPDEESPSA